jgi:hypothetical protein
MITPALLREWNACYSDERILELFGGRESVSLLDVLQSDIPDADRVWVASRALSERDARLFACWCAEQVLPDDCDPRSRAAIEVARRFAYGKAARKELHAAGAAARAAVRAAARAAARGAARGPAWSAAEATAWCAAWSAAEATAWSAARDAAWDAQVARLVRHCTGEEPLR